jgi:hypothetical protein
MLKTVTPKEGTPTANWKCCSGKKVTICGVKVWVKGVSCNEDWQKSPYNERAAYLVDKMLHLNLVPITVLRLRSGKVVSAQRWIKSTKLKGNKPPILHLFDYLIHNTDRHDGNWLMQGNKVWAIDNAYSFYTSDYARFYNNAQDLSPIYRAKLRKRLQLVLAEPQKIHEKFDWLIGEHETSALIDRMIRIVRDIDRANEITD